MRESGCQVKVDRHQDDWLCHRKAHIWDTQDTRRSAPMEELTWNESFHLRRTAALSS